MRPAADEGRSRSSTRSGCRTTGAGGASSPATPRTTSRTWRSTRTSTSRRSRRSRAGSGRAAGRAAQSCRSSSPSCASRRIRAARHEPRVEPEAGEERRERCRRRPGDATATSSRSASASSPTRPSASAARPARSRARSGTSIPDDGHVWTGHSYDNTGELSANTWRHVAFIEQEKPLRTNGDGGDRAPLADGVGRLQALHARGLPRRLPDGRALPHRVRHGRRAAGHLQRLRLLRPACPFGVLDKRHLAPAPDLPAFAKEDGRVWKCTLCYDRLKGGHEPACAKACPTKSIQFGPLEELRERADARLAKLTDEGWNGAQLYGRDPEDGVGGFGAFFLLLDEPEVYGLPPDPVVTTRDLPEMWTNMLAAAGAMLAGVTALTLLGGRR